MFKHLFINRIKILIRKKDLMFWTLVFPLALATFFNLAFSNLAEQEQFRAIDIAVVENENLQNKNEFRILLNTLGEYGEDQVFNIYFVSSEEYAIEKLKANDIIGYYIVLDNIEVVVNSSGLRQTIMKTVVNNYYQMSSIVSNLYEFNPEEFRFEMLAYINNENNYFVDASSSNVDFTVIMFYALIGMVAISAGFFGLDSVIDVEANLSKKAARISVSSVHKFKNLVSSLLAGFSIAYIQMLILLFYLINILGVNFGDQTIWILLLTFVGIFTGTALGALLGVMNKKSERFKSAIINAVTLGGAFLAGMMVWNMRYIIEQRVPFINQINPVALVSDSLYSLYYFDTLDRYFSNLINLSILGIVMVIITYVILRRKTYDSI